MRHHRTLALTLLVLPLLAVAEEAALEDVVVTATRTKMKPKDLPASIDVVKERDLRLDAGAGNYYEAMRKTPGALMMNGGHGGRIALRGQVPSMLADGRDMNAFVSATSMMFNPLSVGMGSIERIEVIKGPQAAVHGSQALTGVVNVIRKKGDKDDPFVELGGSFGQGGVWNAGARTGGGSGKWAWFLDLEGGNKPKLLTPDGAFEHGREWRRNLYGRIDREISENHSVSLDVTHGSSHTESGTFGTYFNQNEYSNLYGAEPEHTAVFLSYKGKAKERISLDADLGLVLNDHNAWNGRPNTKPELFLSKAETYRYKENVLQGQARGTFSFPEKGLKAIAGLQAKRTGIDTSGTQLKDGKRVPWDGNFWKETESYVSPYAQLEYKPIGHLLLIAGIRHDHYVSGGKTMTATSPNVGLSVFPFAGTSRNWTTLWASYSHAFRTPNAAQRYLPGWLGGNPDLNPERSRNFEVGIKQSIGKWGRVEANWFDNDYRDLITLEKISKTDWLFSNKGRSRFKGYELMAEVTPLEWLSLHASWSVLDRRDVKTKKKLVNQPGNTFRFGLGVNELKGFSFSLSGARYGDFKIALGGKEVPHPSEGVLVMDAKLLYRHRFGNGVEVEPFVSVTNLTNKRYYSATYDPVLMDKRIVSVGLNVGARF